MIKYEEKFFVINKKHLINVPKEFRENFTTALSEIRPYLPDNKYYVCNQDEPYAEDVLKLILFDEMQKQLAKNDNRKEFSKKQVIQLGNLYNEYVANGGTYDFEDWFAKKEQTEKWEDLLN